MTTPKTSAPEWAGSQAQPNVTVNEALRRIEAGAGLFRVEDDDATAPPGSCADGAQYIPAATATGDWAGKELYIAIAVGVNAANGWYFIAPEEGMRARIKDENVFKEYSGSAWVAAASGTGDLLAANNLSDLASAATARTNLSVYSIAQVDGLITGLSWKQAVRVATTANGTLATAFENGDTVDGVVLATGDRILLKNQSAAAENGIYVVAASGAPARAADADSGAELVNASLYVSEGTANADTQWVCTTNAPITPGVTSLGFAQLTSGGGALQASNNLSDVSSPVTAGANIRPVESLIVACGDESTAITTGTAKVTFRAPYAFTVTDVRASCNTAPTGSTIVIDINEAGVSILSTKLSIDVSEKTSTTAATPAVISDATLADDAEITIDFDQVGSTIAGAGVKVTLIGHRT